VGTQQCGVCGRGFAFDRIAVHQVQVPPAVFSVCHLTALDETTTSTK
jgi:hypothetical protein